MTKIKDLTGLRFNRLTVICQVERKGVNIRWKCKCDCGEEIELNSNNLKSGNTKSCGCSYSKHGCSKLTPEYAAWRNMKSRCLNPNTPYYKDYGSRGISICEFWLGEFGFQNFLEDMGNKTDETYSLDRKRNNEGYCRENCRWATKKQQSNNRRKRICRKL